MPTLLLLLLLLQLSLHLPMHLSPQVPCWQQQPRVQQAMAALPKPSKQTT
jgi:fatty acid desaturase